MEETKTRPVTKVSKSRKLVGVATQKNSFEGEFTMKKEQILALGVDEEIAKQIMTIHSTDFTKLKQELAQKDELINEQKNMSTELESKINQLQEQNEQTESQVKAIQLDSAVDVALAKSGVLYPDLVKKAMDVTKLDFKDGKLEGYDEQIESMKESYANLFTAPTTTTTAESKTSYKPNGGTATTKTYDSFADAVRANDVSTYYKENGGQE